ncbi:hypothetical protein WDU94_006914 [Cyamophila willieti]
MMAKCGKMLVLVFMIAMFVQDTFSVPTPQQNAAVDPFDTIPPELKLTGWNPQNEDEKKKLENLALIGLNKIRTDNGVKGTLMFQEQMSMWSDIMSEQFYHKMLQEGDKFNASASAHPASQFFTEYLEYKTEDQAGTSSTSDIVVESIRSWYKKIQEKVKNGEKKESLAIFNPDIKHVGLGLYKMTREVKGTVTSHYFFVLDFGTDAQFEKFEKEIKSAEKEIEKSGH